MQLKIRKPWPRTVLKPFTCWKSRKEKGRFPHNSQSRIGQEVEGTAVPVRGKHYVPQGASGPAASFSHLDFLGMFFPLFFRKIFLKIRKKYIYIYIYTLIYTYICVFILFFSINGNKDKRKVWFAVQFSSLSSGSPMNLLIYKADWREGWDWITNLCDTITSFTIT